MTESSTDQVYRVAGLLNAPNPWDLAAIITQVSDMAGKPIRLVPHTNLATSGLPCGLLVERVDDVIIAYDANSSGYHGDHIVLHEIAHLLLGHTSSDALGSLLPGCDPNAVLRVLGRTDYDAEQESQAELFASIVMSRHGSGRRSALRESFFHD